MINILKPFGGSVTALLHDKFFLATLKLTAFYVLSTAVILFVSSVAVLIIFAPPETELPFRAEIELIEEENDEWNTNELREHLASVVAMVDAIVLLIVSIFSYYFARRTLLPIKNMHQRQTQFMGDVAHELRTPLSVMQAGADTVLKRPRTVMEYEEFITDVKEEILRMTRLSNQLLQLLKTEDVTKTVSRTVDVSLLAKTELRRFAPYAEERKVGLVDDILPGIMLCTEADSFIEILQNILKNAIDYNRLGGQVTMTLTQSDSAVHLAIADTGVGMSPEVQAVVFNRFVKGNLARTPTMGSGAGLGLSIVKALVTKLGGQLELKSTPNLGTTITITLPQTHS